MTISKKITKIRENRVCITVVTVNLKRGLQLYLLRKRLRRGLRVKVSVELNNSELPISTRNFQDLAQGIQITVEQRSIVDEYNEKSRSFL